MTWKFVLYHQEINTLMEQSYQDRPQFSLGGSKEDTVTMGGMTNQDMIDQDKCRISREIHPNRIMVRPNRITVHKIIRPNRITVHPDKVKEETTKCQ